MENPTDFHHLIVIKKECLLYLLKLSQAEKEAYLYVTLCRTLQFLTILLYSKKNASFIYLNFHKPRKMHIYI